LPELFQTIAIRLRRGVRQLRHLPRVSALIWNAAGWWTVIWAALLLAQGLLPVATVYLTRLLVDSLVASLGRGVSWSTGRPILSLVALMAGVVLLAELLRSLTNWVRAVQSELLKDHIQARLHEQSLAVDLAFYDSPEFYDHLHRAREEAPYRPLALLESVGGLAQNAVTLAAMGAVLLSFGVWLPLALLLSTLPALAVVLGSTLREHQWRRDRTRDERRTWYFDWLLTSRETASELRIFDLGDYFQSAYKSLRQRLRNERIDLVTRQCVAEAGASVIGLVVAGVALAWMVWKTSQHALTLGQLTLFYQAFNNGQRLMRSQLAEFGQFYANSLFLGNLFEFLALEPRVVESKHPVRGPSALTEGLRFRRVTFRYPDSDRLILDDFDLLVPAGQIAAVVGLNGAGKSTLIKLLCRLYDPISGRIELDGIDLRDFSLRELRSRITVLLQEPVRYSATVAENITLGDLGRSQSESRVVAAAWAAGADECVARLPQRYRTVLGKRFAEGAELSVGEWQRLALARTFLRDSPIIALDEPTSAMDPWAEAEWVSRFRQVAAGRTAIVITHRVTTAMRADVIHVMAQGRIVESGSHDELLTLGGLYSRLWKRHSGRAERTSAPPLASEHVCQPA